MLRAMPTIGIWVDDSPNVVLESEYFARLSACGIQTLAVMVEWGGGGFNPKWSVDQLKRLRDFAFNYDKEIVLTTWPEPNPSYLKAYRSMMIELCVASGASAQEVDTEGNWRTSRVSGFSSLAGASVMLVQTMREIRAELDVRCELTTFTSHTENGRAAMVAPYMDRLYPQAYSVHHRNKQTIAWDHIYGPGSMQKMTLDRTLLVKRSLTMKLGVGLAAYDQKWPNHLPEEALKKAYDKACEYNPVEIRYWSSKWVVGKRANSATYTARFLQDLHRAKQKEA